MRLRLLIAEDLPGLLGLTACAGWNQTGDDWLRLLRLWPEGCWGLEDAGRVVATATVVMYEQDLAWIGMVLTLPEYRGRGLARQLMEHLLARCGDAVVRLDASDMGKPLYEQLGFVEECLVERWRRAPGPAEIPEVGTEPVHSCDAEVFGARRDVLLEELQPLGYASVGQSYAFGRSGAFAAYFGPCVAVSDEDADRLARWFVAQHPHEPVVWDLFPHSRAAGVASRLGFRPVRRLTRMVRRPHAVALPDARVYGIAGFEYG